MSLKIIQERLKEKNYASWQEEEGALKEIFQEIALAGLARADFFKKAAFQGGTALRILYSLNRFSEDLDFILKQVDASFSWTSFLKAIQEEFLVYGITMSIKDRSKVDSTVKKIFLKDNSLGTILEFDHFPKQPPKKIRIKLEVDTNPPAGSEFETKFLDFPFPFAITVQNLPSLFAGKSHALLCREYIKGRDWYDFLWYVARQTPLNFNFLTQATHQQGPWAGENISIDKEWYLTEMANKIKALDWKQAKQDVERFMRKEELQSLELWSQELFLDRVEKLRGYL